MILTRGIKTEWNLRKYYFVSTVQCARTLLQNSTIFRVNAAVSLDRLLWPFISLLGKKKSCRQDGFRHRKQSSCIKVRLDGKERGSFREERPKKYRRKSRPCCGINGTNGSREECEVTDSTDHSQASLLSKLDRPMAKACSAHMG